MTKKLTLIEKAMRKLQDARNFIRDAIKEGCELEGFLEDFMNDTTSMMDTLDSVNEENKRNSKLL